MQRQNAKVNYYMIASPITTTITYTHSFRATCITALAVCWYVIHAYKHTQKQIYGLSIRTFHENVYDCDKPSTQTDGQH